MKAKPIELAKFPSMQSLSAQVGIPIGILKDAKRNGCPAFRTSGVDLIEFVQWFFQQNLDPEAKENWHSRDKRAGALIKEEVLMQKRREVIPKPEIVALLNDIIGVKVSGELDRLSQELPPRLKGANEMKIFLEVKREKDKIRSILFDAIAQWEKQEAEEAEEE